MAANPEQFTRNNLREWVAFLAAISAFLFGITILVMVHDLSETTLEDEINPVYPEFRLDSATVSQFNVTGPELTAAWDLKYAAVNPNRMLGISFDNLQSAILFNGTMLATKLVPPPRSLYEKTEASQSIRLETASAYVGDDVAKEIAGGWSRGSVTFELKMWGRYRYSTFVKGSRSFSFFCNPVEFGFSPPGNWSGTLMKSNQSTEKIFMIACSVVFITSGIVTTIVFVQEQRFDPEFRLDSATVSRLNITGPELTATWDLTFAAVNPNHKFTLSFRALQSTMYFKAANRTTVMLATKPVPPPQSLGPKSEAVGSFRVVTVSAYVGDDVAKEIEGGVAGGAVAFRLNFLGWLRNSSYSEARISVYCNRVEFGFLPGNWTGTLTMKNESRVCGRSGRVSKVCRSGMDY